MTIPATHAKAFRSSLPSRPEGGFAHRVLTRLLALGLVSAGAPQVATPAEPAAAPAQDPAVDSSNPALPAGAGEPSPAAVSGAVPNASLASLASAATATPVPTSPVEADVQVVLASGGRQTGGTFQNWSVIGEAFPATPQQAANGSDAVRVDFLP